MLPYFGHVAYIARRANLSQGHGIAENPNHEARMPPSRSDEGRLANVTNVGWDAMDAMAPPDERRASRTTKSFGPGAPMQVLSLLKSSGGDGDKKARSLRGDYEGNRENHRAGNAGSTVLNLW